MKEFQTKTILIYNSTTQQLEPVSALRGESAYMAAKRLGLTNLAEEEWLNEYIAHRDAALEDIRDAGSQTIAAIETEKTEALENIDNAVGGKLNNSGHTPNKYLGTDANGNVVVKDAPSGDFSGVGISSIEQTTTSTEDGGKNVITATLSNGQKSTFEVRNGQQGSPGHSPVKGTDYWTEADRAAIVQQVIDALETPVFGQLSTDNVITLTGDLVADGTYTFRYEAKDGKTYEIGAIVISDVPVVTLTWFDGVKLDKSTGAESSDVNYFASDYVEIISGYTYTAGKRAGTYPVGVNIMYYTADKQVIASAYQTGIPNAGTDTGELSVVLVIPSNAAYFRLRCYDSDYVTDTLTQTAPLVYVDVAKAE